jgi:hypothetical protein
MDRRKFLLGSVSVAALGAFDQPAPTPFVEGPPLMVDVELANVPASLAPGHITWYRNIPIRTVDHIVFGDGNA